MLERVARIAFGIDDDQIGAQLRDALMQEDIGRQRGHDVVLRLEQAHAQRTRALELLLDMLLLLVREGRIRNDDDDAQGMTHGIAQARKMPFCASNRRCAVLLAQERQRHIRRNRAGIWQALAALQQLGLGGGDQ